MDRKKQYVDERDLATDNMMQERERRANQSLQILSIGLDDTFVELMKAILAVKPDLS